jgi:hypothetical protein
LRARRSAGLTAYLADKTSWPTRQQFLADGLRDLRVAITRRGGIDRWLDEYNLPRPHRCTGRTRYWTETRIRSELTTLCAGRDVFPARREFQRAGLAGMYQALNGREGANWWARELGLPRYRRGGGLVTG